ncbi:MAG TPA: site-2 protease family protein [Candidatus Thermoplasmatota archaeon]|nr:site-2 protease family protein [Candidatus Thermoplasmatota archaeon]
MAATLLDVASLRATVERRFPVYDVQYDPNIVTFYVSVDPATLEPQFEALREELRRQQLLPLLKYQGGEHALFIVEKPERKPPRKSVNLLLFLLTWVTTTTAGAAMYFSYANANLDQGAYTFGEWWGLMFSPMNFLWGFVFFAFPLMLILGVHEMGHYYMTRKHGMDATLPYFIPVPPFFTLPIGTMGAFISMREPIPNRKALLDIGASGPIAGFVVAVPVILAGLFLMKFDGPVIVTGDAASGESLSLGLPLLYQLLQMPFGFSESQMIHPTAFAGWVGLFVTAINLLPAGQLDGGHIASALLGDKARYLSYGAMATLILLGFGIPFLPPEWGLTAGYSGWLIFALLIAFMGLRHPPTLNGITPLDRKRQIWAWITFSLILLCFTPVPISGG